MSFSGIRWTRARPCANGFHYIGPLLIFKTFKKKKHHKRKEKSASGYSQHISCQNLPSFHRQLHLCIKKIRTSEPPKGIILLPQKARLLAVLGRNHKAGVPSDVTRNPHADTPSRRRATASPLVRPGTSGCHRDLLTAGRDGGLGPPCPTQPHPREKRAKSPQVSPPPKSPEQHRGAGLQAGHCQPSSPPTRPHAAQRRLTPGPVEVHVGYQFILWLRFPVLRACVCAFKDKYLRWT